MNDINHEQIEGEEDKVKEEEEINSLNKVKTLINKWIYLASQCEFDDLKPVINNFNDLLNNQMNQNTQSAILSISSPSAHLQQISSSTLTTNDTATAIITENTVVEEIIKKAVIDSQLADKRSSPARTSAITTTAPIAAAITASTTVATESTNSQVKTKLSTDDELSHDEAIKIYKSNKPATNIMSSSITELTETEKTMNLDINNSCDPNVFIKCLEKLLNSIQIVDKHLDNTQKLNKEFYDFERQNLKLNSIKDALESLSTAIKTSLKHKKSICDKANKELNKKISKLLNQLTKDHQDIVKKYKDKDALYTKNYDIWKEFHKDFFKMNEWLTLTLARINDLKQLFDYERTDELIRDFSNLTSYRLLLERTNLNGHEIVTKSNEIDAKQLSDKLECLNKAWKNLITSLNELKEKHKTKFIELQMKNEQTEKQYKASLPSTSTSTSSSTPPNAISPPTSPTLPTSPKSTIDAKTAFEQFNNKLNEIHKWVINGQLLIKKQVSPVDELENERFIFELRVIICVFFYFMCV